MLTLNDLLKKRSQGEKIACLTAYDATFAKIMDDNNIDIILIGDSLGMVIQGHKDTLSVKVNHIAYHTKCVSNVCQNAMVMADMPFLSYRSKKVALKNAGRLLASGASMVKLEGGQEIASIIQFLNKNFIPVCGHIGLKPQQVRQLGGYKRQGMDEQSADKIINDAVTLTEAGVQMLLIENTDQSLCQKIREKTNLLTIGIGSGNDSDGQILVIYDVLGISSYIPSFSRDFLSESNNIQEAIKKYIEAVKNQQFP